MTGAFSQKCLPSHKPFARSQEPEESAFEGRLWSVLPMAKLPVLMAAYNGTAEEHSRIPTVWKPLGSFCTRVCGELSLLVGCTHPFQCWWRKLSILFKIASQQWPVWSPFPERLLILCIICNFYLLTDIVVRTCWYTMEMWRLRFHDRSTITH